MKKIFFFVFIFFTEVAFSQTLTINETLSYLNKILTDNPRVFKNYLGENCIGQSQMELSSNGKITIRYRNVCKYQLSTVSEEKTAISVNEYYFYLSDFNPQNIYDLNLSDDDTKIFNLSCRNNENCITHIEDERDGSHKMTTEASIFLRTPPVDSYQRKKLFNACKYLLTLILESKNYSRRDTDPFAQKNYDNVSSSNPVGSSATPQSNKCQVRLKAENGIYSTEIKISGIQKHFFIDSGASDVTISTDLENTLIQNKSISKNSYLSNALYKTADGSIQECKRVIIDKITIGSLTIKNVIASVGNSNSPLLLGKSFLDKFKRWSIDNSSSTLTLEM